MVEQTVHRRNPDVSWRIIEGQAVLVFNIEGEVQVLNEVGTYIWEHLEEEDVDTLAGNIAKTFAVSEEEARRDLLAFLQDLRKSGALL